MRCRALHIGLGGALLLLACRAEADVRSGKAPMKEIVIPRTAPEPVRFAASELQRYLKQSTGTDLAIREGAAGPGAFFITTTELTPEAIRRAGGLPKGQFDRAVIAERGGCVTLVGENPRSALYAVYDFLQDRLGIRFFAPGAQNEVVPRHARLVVSPGFTLRTGSAFEFRNYMSWSAECHDFLAKNRINMILSVEEEFGGNHREARKRGLMLRGPGHIWRHFLPDAEMLATHPHYFPMREGKRVATGQGACFSNPEVRALFAKKAGDYVRGHSFWDVFALWAEDTYYPSYCDCPECAKKTPGEWYLTLINEAAPVVEKELPNGLFEFIAYHETRWPSKAPIPVYTNGRRMMLDLCLGYSRDLFHPLAARSAESAEVDDMYQAWRRRLKEIGFEGKVILFEYYNWCEMPNMGPSGRSLLWPMAVIQEDTRAYRKDGLDGLGDFVCFHKLAFPTPFNVWSWLRMYSTPNRPLADMEGEFYRAWFGRCGAAVRAYVHALEKTMAEQTSPDNIAAVEALGEKLATIQAPEGDAELARRLQVVRIHHAYCVLNKRVFLAFLRNDEAGWQRLEKEYRDFFPVTHRAALEGAIDTPPGGADMYYDFFVKHGAGMIQGLANRASCR